MITPRTAIRVPETRTHRPLPPRIKVSYPKSMTIAAGFVARDGILLCTDSQYTGAEKAYRPKIISEECGERVVVFALSGDEDYAKSAITDSYESIRSLPSDASVWDVRKSIRRAVSAMSAGYRKHQPEGQMMPQFLVAISTSLEGMLFSSHESAMPQVASYACLGSGGYLANYVASFLQPDELKPIWALLPIAVQMILAAKKHDSYCGGGSHFMAIQGTSSRGFFFQDPAQSDAIFNRYAWLSSNLLAALSNKHLSSEDFKTEIDRFATEVAALQSSMHSPDSALRRLREYLIPLTPQRPQSTTAD